MSVLGPLASPPSPDAYSVAQQVPRSTRVVLTDWGASTERLPSRHALAYELLFLSLLYDEVLIQDEVLVLSQSLAEAFSAGSDFALLRKCFDVGALRVLEHTAYSDPAHAEVAQKQPLRARASYISAVGTKEEVPWSPSPRQEAFHEACDAMLSASGTRRTVANAFSIMPAFNSLLRTVLTTDLYAPWIQSAFGPVPGRVAEEFVSLLEDPDRVPARLAHRGHPCKYATEDGRIVFNRSLGFQVAALYPDAATALRALIQSAFVAPFCARENAYGRFNMELREFLWAPDDAQAALLNGAITVQANASIPIGLPPLDADFVDAIARVREGDAGRALRAQMANPGSDLTFAAQENAWRAVVDELSRIPRTRTTHTLDHALLDIGCHSFVGTILHSSNAVATPSPVFPEVLGAAFLAGGLGLACSHIRALLKQDLKRQALRETLEQAVTFRCSLPEIPPVQASPLPPNPA